MFNEFLHAPIHFNDENGTYDRYQDDPIIWNDENYNTQYTIIHPLDYTELKFNFTLCVYDNEMLVDVIGMGMPKNYPEPTEDEECYKDSFGTYTLFGTEIFIEFLRLLTKDIHDIHQNASSLNRNPPITLCSSEGNPMISDEPLLPDGNSNPDN